MVADGYNEAVTVTPAVENFDVFTNVDEPEMTMYVNGSFLPDTEYAIELAGTMKDKWGQALGDPYVLNFRTPSLAFSTPR